MITWTHDLPTVSGFYWYHEQPSAPEVIEWDNDMQWLCTPGSDICIGPDTNHPITGKFWPIPLTPP